MLRLFFPPLLLWASDRWLRLRNFQRLAFPISRLSPVGGGATRLEVDISGGHSQFSFRPGQWCYLALRFAEGDNIRESELHPFSICCAPGSGKAVFLVKAVGGPESFSRRLRLLAGHCQSQSGGAAALPDPSEMPEVHFDGPYGCLSLRLGQASGGGLIRSVFLIGGGVGVTPLASVGEAMLSGGRAVRVHFLWVCREREAFSEWIPEAMAVRENRIAASARE